VPHYGPQQQIWLCAMGHCGGFGSALWAAAQNEAIHTVKICDDMCAVGHSAGFSFAPWDIARDLVLRCGL
jgi:hypothetical protein